MKQFLARQWFLIALLGLLTLGLVLHEPLERLLTRHIPQQPVTAIVIFLMALPLDSASMWQAIRRPTAVLLAVTINFGLLPVVAWSISGLLRADLAIGLMIAASVPCTLAAAAVWTRRAGGNDAVALLVTLATNLSCFFVTPLWLVLTTGTSVRLDPLSMMQKLALVVLLPTLAGQVARQFAPIASWVADRKDVLGSVAQCGILTIVLVGAVSAGDELGVSDDQIGAAGWLLMIASVVGVHLSMLACGHLLSAALRLSRPDRIAVGFAGSQKTLPIGLYIAVNHFGGLTMLPMVAFHFCQLISDTLVADRLRGRT